MAERKKTSFVHPDDLEVPVKSVVCIPEPFPSSSRVALDWACTNSVQSVVGHVAVRMLLLDHLVHDDENHLEDEW